LLSPIKSLRVILETNNNKNLPFLFTTLVGIVVFSIAAADGQINGVGLMRYDGEWKKTCDRGQIRNWIGVGTTHGHIASEFKHKGIAVGED